jgi:hypothetical protein
VFFGTPLFLYLGFIVGMSQEMYPFDCMLLFFPVPSVQLQRSHVLLLPPIRFLRVNLERKVCGEIPASNRLKYLTDFLVNNEFEMIWNEQTLTQIG